MVNSRNISKSNKPDKVPWIIRHQNITSLIVFLSAFLISTYFTEILKPQPPYYELNIPKLILSLSIAIISYISSKKVSVLISSVIGGLYNLKTNFIEIVNREISKIYETIGSAFYNGFFSLLSGGKIQEGVKLLENSLGQAITSNYIGRSVIFNFMIDSISKIGESGFAMTHASVGDYVNYISRVLKDTKINVTATCVVRPYWFMTDEIRVTKARGPELIVLAPCYTDYHRFGKAEHLPLFLGGKNNVKYQRILVVDENMIAEVFLTGYIDKVIATEEKFSSFRTQTFEVKQLSDIWEIEWFRKEINEGVDLKYTFLPGDSKVKGEVKELEDRIYGYKNSELKLEIRFQFTNLESGNFSIRWGDQTIPLEFISGKEYQYMERTHSIYEKFIDLLRVNRPELKQNMLTFLGYLNILTQRYFSHALLSITDTDLNKLIGPQNKDLQRLIEQSINSLTNDFEKKEICAIYDDLVQSYKDSGVPKRAYIITYDKGHPELPVRVAHWEKNWQSVTQNNAKKY